MALLKNSIVIIGERLLLQLDSGRVTVKSYLNRELIPASRTNRVMWAKERTRYCMRGKRHWL